MFKTSLVFRIDQFPSWWHSSALWRSCIEEPSWDEEQFWFPACKPSLQTAWEPTLSCWTAEEPFPWNTQCKEQPYIWSPPHLHKHSLVCPHISWQKLCHILRHISPPIGRAGRRIHQHKTPRTNSSSIQIQFNIQIQHKMWIAASFVFYQRFSAIMKEHNWQRADTMVDAPQRYHVFGNN